RTAAPQRWQLPGGSVEPPQPGEQLDTAALAGHAARELAEETGLPVDPADLQLHTVTRGSREGNIGLHWLAPPVAEEEARDRFASVLAPETAQGRTPELRAITVVGSPHDLAALPGDHADYLDTVLARLGSVQISA